MKNLESTRNIPEKSILRVYKKGFGYSRLEVLINTEYFLCARAEDDFMKSLDEGDSLETYLWVENVASYDFPLSVSGKISRPESMIFFEHTDKITRSEERKCLTAKVSLPLRFFIFTSRRIQKSFTSEEIVYHSGTVTEMSDREFLIQTDDDLPEKHFIYGHIPVNGETLEVIGKYSSMGSGSYSVMLNGMSDRDRMKLLEYIFNTYRE